MFNFSNFNSVNNYKKDNHPLLNFFSYYNNCSDNKLKNLIFLKKLFNFLKLNGYSKNCNSFFEFVILQYFLTKKYFDFLVLFYYDTTNSNLTKLNFLFNFFNKNFKNNIKRYNLNYYNDWFAFVFSDKKKISRSNLEINKNTRKILKEKKINYLKKTIKLYKKIYGFNDITFFSNVNKFIFNFFNKKNLFFFKKLNLNKNYFVNLKKYLPIRFSETSVNKYINLYNLSNFSFFYLRKNKIFNKSRYSRNRQLYRTGVY